MTTTTTPLQLVAARVDGSIEADQPGEPQFPGALSARPHLALTAVAADVGAILLVASLVGWLTGPDWPPGLALALVPAWLLAVAMCGGLRPPSAAPRCRPAAARRGRARPGQLCRHRRRPRPGRARRGVERSGHRRGHGAHTGTRGGLPCARRPVRVEPHPSAAYGRRRGPRPCPRPARGDGPTRRRGTTCVRAGRRVRRRGSTRGRTTRTPTSRSGTACDEVPDVVDAHGADAVVVVPGPDLGHAELRRLGA